MIEVLIKYSEIGLKGKNKHVFENALIKNIKYSAKKNKTNLKRVVNEKGRIICYFDKNETKDKINETLEVIFGIKFFSYVQEIKKDINEILKTGEIHMNELNCKSISFKTKRADKNFPFQSPEINSKLGEIAKKKGIKIDYKNAPETIYTEITFKKCYMYAKKHMCHSGLPVGTSGRGLVLLSGGIDSPIAAWQMMKRGVSCDFLHFHTYPKNEMVLKSKIKDTIKILNKYQIKSRIYLVPYSMYDILTSGKIPSRYELVFFKHFILKFADKICKEYHYDAIVNGDNIAQVASQTMENLNAASLTIEKQILRPLLTYEKEEIITIARKINTFDIATQEYGDCCSIHSKNPLTKAKLEKMQEIIDNFDIENLLEKTKEEMEIVKIE